MDSSFTQDPRCRDSVAAESRGSAVRLKPRPRGPFTGMAEPRVDSRQARSSALIRTQSQEDGTCATEASGQLPRVIHRLYCHIVWTTRDRASLSDSGLAWFLCKFLRRVAQQERAQLLEIGMVRTHVHVLARIHPTTDLSRLLQRLKGASAAVSGKGCHSTEGHPLRWAKGYSIHSVSARSVAAVRHYLRQQPVHHPTEVIVGWPGDEPEYETAGQDEWRSESRRRL